MYSYLITFAFLFRVFVIGRDLPSYFPVCQRNTPNLDRCLINAAHTVKPYLRKGVKELNFPPLDPLVLPKVNLEQGTQAISYIVTLRNTTIKGMEDFTLEELHFDLDNLTLSGMVTFPKINAVTNYDVDGKILVAPIKGRGILTVNTGQLNATFTLNGKLTKRQNHHYITSTGVKIKIQVNTGSGHFEGIINDNEELSAATNRILNENSLELLRDAVPALERVSEEFLIGIWTEMNALVPYEKILPLS